MSRGRRALAVLAVVLASVALGEVLVRLLLEPPGRWTVAESPVIIEHPILGYALRPGATGQYPAGGHAAQIRINEQGWRGVPLSTAMRADVRVLAVGDSFTFGLGVDSTDPWPEQLEQLLAPQTGQRVSVVNAGVPGYSARQMRQVVEALLPTLRPAVVVFGMNSETYWRIQDPYVYRAGQLVRSSALSDFTVGRDGLYYSPIVRWKWLNRFDVWLNQHFELGAHVLRLAYRLYGTLIGGSKGAPVPAVVPVDTAEVRRRLVPMVAEIRKAAAAAGQAGARFVVLLINPQLEDGSFAPVQHAYNHVVTDFCRAEGIEVVDPLPVLVAHAGGEPVYRTADDYHWTRAAHRIAAQELYGRLGSLDPIRGVR